MEDYNKHFSYLAALCFENIDDVFIDEIKKEIISFYNAKTNDRKIAGNLYRIRRFDNFNSSKRDINKLVLNSIIKGTQDAKIINNEIGNIKNNIKKYIQDQICCSKKCWAPPSNVAKEGRLNKEGEPVLYVASHPAVAIIEMNIENYEIFALITYKKPKDIINLKHIAFQDEDLNVHICGKNYVRETKDFVEQGFKIKTGSCQNIYAATLKMVNNFYPLTEDFDAWIYPSVAVAKLVEEELSKLASNDPEIANKKLEIEKEVSKWTYNLCFKDPEIAKQKLEIEK